MRNDSVFTCAYKRRLPVKLRNEGGKEKHLHVLYGTAYGNNSAEFPAASQ